MVTLHATLCRRLLPAAALVLLVGLFPPALAAANSTPSAARPPMGWNSWNCFGVDVREEQVRAAADSMHRNLRAHGWEYIVVDLGWYLGEGVTTANFKQPRPPQAIDAYGRLVPAVHKFPSSANGAGFRPLADHVHSLGLKFGLHIMRGIPWQAVEGNLTVLEAGVGGKTVANANDVCPWYHGMLGVDARRPGAAAYYRSLVKLYAEWGVDFIKADDMSFPYHRDEIELLAAAIRESGRPILLSLSPGETPRAEAAHVRAHANLWRISADFWDDWRLLRKQFGLCRNWQGVGGPGAWPDCDMLPLGKLRITGPDDYSCQEMGRNAAEITNEYSRLTPDEQVTLVTLWALFRSPLMMGGYLPENQPATLALLTNDEILAVNQQGSRAREVVATADRVIWRSELPGGDIVLGVFNLSDRIATDATIVWDKVGLAGVQRVRDLWSRSELGRAEGRLILEVPAHGARCLRFTSAGAAAATPSKA